MYINCSFISRHDMGIYGECKIWKESGYKDEKFPMLIQPNINEEYSPPISKEDIIKQAKEQCEKSLSQYSICEIIGLWK